MRGGLLFNPFPGLVAEFEFFQLTGRRGTPLNRERAAPPGDLPHPYEVSLHSGRKKNHSHEGDGEMIQRFQDGSSVRGTSFWGKSGPKLNDFHEPVKVFGAGKKY